MLILLFSSIVLWLFGCKPKEPALPIFELYASKDTIEIGETWNDGGIYIKYGVAELSPTVTNNINNQVPGQYEVTYTAKSGKKTFVFKRYVQVLDQIAPVITLNPGIDTIKVGETWVDASVLATDNYLTPTVVKEGTVNTNQVGTYIITYIATDSSGNQARAYRYIRVVE
jgi:hypothetical protein